MKGPGVYDKLATLARELSAAHTVVLFVAGGRQGSGFSVQTVDPTFAAELPAVLRDIASQIERDVAAGLR